MSESASTAKPHGVAVNASGLNKSYGGRPVLQGAVLTIAPGEFITIVGRSGCGKSTLLRLLAGLERSEDGDIRFDGDDHAKHRDDIRIMFQDARLLP